MIARKQKKLISSLYQNIISTMKRGQIVNMFNNEYSLSLLKFVNDLASLGFALNHMTIGNWDANSLTAIRNWSWYYKDLQVHN